MARTKVVAYADDLLIATRGDSVRAVENYANIELSKIEGWSRRNKIKFNDKKSKVMLVTRRKRRKDKKNYTIRALQSNRTSYTNEIPRNCTGSKI